MKSSDSLLREIYLEIESRLSHTYLEKYIQKPVIDEDKLLILFSIVQNTSFSEIQKKNYIITTMLVQIALDTHDLVTETSKEKDTDFSQKERQLTVLAGDYYSGLYYYLLSQLDDVSMIHTLASAIKEMNELKMTIYYQEFSSVDIFMDEMKKLESLLVIRVAEHMGYDQLKSFTQNWLFIRLLVREKNNFLNEHTSSLIRLLTDGPASNIPKNQVVPTLETTIELCMNRLKVDSSKLPSEFSTLKKHVKAVVNYDFSKNIIVLEEG